jgi:hypothetical protein
VLAGNGTFDYKDNMGLGDNLLPPLMVSSPKGLYPSDNLLADLDQPGETQDYDGPEIAIGRIPVISEEEIRDYVEKLSAYESETPATGRVLMSADDPDVGGDFPGDSAALASLLPAGTTVATIDLSQQPIAVARQLLFDELSAGVDHVNYIGHGALRKLASEGLLTTTDVEGLSNARTPVVTALTCTANFFASPGVESLGESLVVQPDGGAVAVWAPSWLSANGQARDLASIFFSDWYQGGGRSLGDAVLHSLRAMAAAGMPRGQLEGVVLLGDPALGAGSGER